VCIFPSIRAWAIAKHAEGSEIHAGTSEEASKQKKGYKLPRGPMTNADLTRLINSDEIQSVVRPPKTSRISRPLKKNPLRNLGALLKLNPYAKAARRADLLAQVFYPLAGRAVVSSACTCKALLCST
jgi:hypothetical protein